MKKHLAHRITLLSVCYSDCAYGWRNEWNNSVQAVIRSVDEQSVPILSQTDTVCVSGSRTDKSLNKNQALFWVCALKSGQKNH